MATALFPDEIAQQISAKIGIRAQYIDVYPADGGWHASLRPVAGIWTPAKSADVKQTARALQGIYTLKKTASPQLPLAMKPSAGWSSSG
jgi:hypothetical protein